MNVFLQLTTNVETFWIISLNEIKFRVNKMSKIIYQQVFSHEDEGWIFLLLLFHFVLAEVNWPQSQISTADLALN